TQGTFVAVGGAAGALRKVGEGFDVLKAVFKTATSAARWIPTLGVLMGRIRCAPRGMPGFGAHAPRGGPFSPHRALCQWRMNPSPGLSPLSRTASRPRLAE